MWRLSPFLVLMGQSSAGILFFTPICSLVTGFFSAKADTTTNSNKHTNLILCKNEFTQRFPHKFAKWKHQTFSRQHQQAPKPCVVQSQSRVKIPTQSQDKDDRWSHFSLHIKQILPLLQRGKGQDPAAATCLFSIIPTNTFFWDPACSALLFQGWTDCCTCRLSG